MSHSSSTAAQNGLFNDSSSSMDDTARVFNTALIASRSEASNHLHDELLEIMRAPAFKAILSAVRQLAHSEGVTEAKAAELLIHTFKRADRAWSDYVFQEGVNRLRGTAPQN